ncbi:hypothetical protein [Clostridium chauvoei]|uniref:Uncharacterized protein n=2 Tax=Clostridium chauvoei TaxID=46867 RepID=S6FN86_9CLOT|nr:hypothetical protein [Clostridium chauvoei]ATD55409.1 hypothetical protein BTM20_09220 [Clostridium chauvoei]ATD56919.1 hypothetical protein BTM21_03820 [Clostridium chauvoei]MBX7280762.1 hypothetical protein [Clostridium chauvoei]MBX7283245.1 hypothetical protein [Clostridium chauvoei]MBX7285870.1 hypothetical protein [Clostridium chauvoei]
MLEIAIKNILEETTGLDVTPVFGVGEPPFITYTVIPIGGGTIKESQVEIKIIDIDFDNALQIREKILKKLDIEYKDPSLVNHNIVLRSGLAGGGSLFNDSIQMWEVSCIFIIKWRSK